MLSKGAPPIKLNDLCEKLLKLWSLLERQWVISLQKWFYEFELSSIKDLRSVRLMSSWNLKPGSLKCLFGIQILIIWIISRLLRNIESFDRFGSRLLKA